ncbi:MAG: ABC transporter permease [Prevotella sp.]|nr:ABC transporter permease [Prevotella sp.]
MSIFHKGQGAFIKITSLAIGLTVGLVLIAKVQLERNYDRCIADKEHVYAVGESFTKEGADPAEYENTPGGAVPALCRYIPEIEVGTRYTYQYTNEKVMTERLRVGDGTSGMDGSRYAFDHALFADSCFFDIFSTRILQGDAKRILSTAGQCLVSRRLSEKMGGNVVGKAFTFMAAPDRPMIIGGVFETFDENSTFSLLDIVMSLPSIGTYSYDGTSNLMGNDRYHSYVRLRADADMKKVQQEMDKMLKEQLPWEDLKVSGIEDFRFTFSATSDSRMQNPSVRTTCIILGIVALVMLFTAVMNYILVVISTLVGRARLVAIRKVLGAPLREFYLATLREAAVCLALALLIMALLLTAGQDWIRELMGASVTTLFSRQTFAVHAVVCLVVVVCCGVLPGYIYSRIPMVYAYRLFSENKRTWKLSLLAFQFVFSTMLLCVLSTIYRQYDYMLNKDLGYDYEDVAYIEIANPSDSTFVLAREMEKLPCVASTSTAYSLFLANQSGNNVMLPGDPKQLFNFACMYFVEPSIIKTMGLTMLQGTVPEQRTRPGWNPEVIIDEQFARQLKEHTGWDDVIGQTILSTEFGNDIPLTIACVVKDFQLGTLAGADERPAMMISGNIYAKYILIKLHALTSGIANPLQQVQQVCDRLYPDADLNVKLYAHELADSYRETQHTRDLIMIGCLASLLITLIGLIGYVRDEVQRRSRELAIRKVMGATVGEVQGLFIRSIALIAIPSIILGVALGWYLSTLLMEQFAEKIQLVWYVFAASGLFALIVIVAVVYMQTYRVATSNPVNYLKTE